MDFFIEVMIFLLFFSALAENHRRQEREDKDRWWQEWEEFNSDDEY